MCTHIGLRQTATAAHRSRLMHPVDTETAAFRAAPWRPVIPHRIRRRFPLVAQFSVGVNIRRTATGCGSMTSWKRFSLKSYQSFATSGWTGDLHPQAVAHAWRTKKPCHACARPGMYCSSLNRQLTASPPAVRKPPRTMTRNPTQQPQPAPPTLPAQSRPLPHQAPSHRSSRRPARESD